MLKVMFVCHGNICRSPMAQSYFTHLIKKEGLSDKFIIDSSATSREEISNRPYSGTQQILLKKGIKLIDHRAKQITNCDAQNFDYLICMDNYNIRNIKKLIDKKYYNKIFLLLKFANINKDISDPWYTNDFQSTFNDIKIGCEKLFEYIKKNNDF